MVAPHGNAVLCTFFDENEVCYAAGCSVIYHLLLMSSAAIFTSSEVHLARLALLGRLGIIITRARRVRFFLHLQGLGSYEINRGPYYVKVLLIHRLQTGKKRLKSNIMSVS